MAAFEDFEKLDIRIGTVVSAEKVEDADKLLKLEIDFGDEKRIVASGIAEYFQPEDLVGKQMPVLVNLEPRNFRGVESQGMILVADNNGEIVLLHPNREVPPGSKVR